MVIRPACIRSSLFLQDRYPVDDPLLALGVAPQAFAMGVAIAASNSFLFPIGHQASVLVYGPGGYRFMDYTKVGALLTVALFIVSMIFIPFLWPF